VKGHIRKKFRREPQLSKKSARPSFAGVGLYYVAKKGRRKRARQFTLTRNSSTGVVRMGKYIEGEKLRKPIGDVKRAGRNDEDGQTTPANQARGAKHGWVHAKWGQSSPDSLQDNEVLARGGSQLSDGRCKKWIRKKGKRGRRCARSHIRLQEKRPYEKNSRISGDSSWGSGKLGLAKHRFENIRLREEGTAFVSAGCVGRVGVGFGHRRP